ncbi:MAG: DUF327 family protein [Spirochaetales bacterium]|nr:DUF327 family protein [Spirochaetales bacterium]
MAKIGQLSIGSYIPSQLKGEKKETGKSARSGSSRFSSLVGKTEAGQEVEMIQSSELTPLEDTKVLEDLIDRLFESGENLKRNPIEENLDEYKKNVRVLVNFVSHKSYTVTREKGIMNPRTFKQKEFVNIDLVDKKLDSLAVYILSRQKNQMEILRRVDEINGLGINVVR